MSKLKKLSLIKEDTMGKGVIFTGADGKKTRMDRNEFCRYIGNLWKMARETKLENERLDKEVEEVEESGE
jgi:hypothetical protein